LSPTGSQNCTRSGKNGRSRSHIAAASAGSSIMTRSLLRMSFRITGPADDVIGASP
jgi:hypothetical protein